MNADPLMRADLAGLTRPDGCFWNPGTLARARNEQNRGLNRQRELDIPDHDDDGQEGGRRREGERGEDRGPRYKRSPPYCIGNLTVPI